MYANVHFLGGKLVTVEGANVTTKAHQRYEGSPYSPLDGVLDKGEASHVGSPEDMGWAEDPQTTNQRAMFSRPYGVIKVDSPEDLAHTPRLRSQSTP